MKRFLMIGGVALLAVAMLAPVASAQTFVRFGAGPRFYGPRYFGPRVFVGPGFYSPGWWGYSGLGWYEPYGYVPAPKVGKVKFDTKVKDAQVYVDGAYAGTAQQLGSFPLKPGSHQIELRDATGQTMYNQQINVILGKTLKIKV